MNLTISASAGGRSGQGVGSGIFHSLSPHTWHVLVGIELDPSQSCGELLRSHGSPGLIQGFPGRDYEEIVMLRLGEQATYQEIVGPWSRVCANLNGSRNVHFSY